MFMGEYRHSIDAKGRLTLPSEFREEFDNCVVVAKGLDGCLNIYSVKDWEVYLRKLSTIPTQKKDARAYVRVIASRAKKCEFDKVGRINIPQVVRNEAHVDKYHLCHLFKVHTGMSVINYLHHRRIIEAEKLLIYTALPTGVVCTETGFNTIQHFYRVFREITGITPGEYRAKHR